MDESEYCIQEIILLGLNDVHVIEESLAGLHDMILREDFSDRDRNTLRSDTNIR